MRKDQRKISLSSLGLETSNSAFLLQCPFQIPLSMSELLTDAGSELGGKATLFLFA